MSPSVIFNLLIFVAGLFALWQLSRRETSLARRVFIGLVAGTMFGFFLQVLYGVDSQVSSDTLDWVAIVGSSYVNLLRMIIMPLVLVTMIAAVLKVEEIKSLGSIGGSVIAVLVGTTMIAALVGILIASAFGLNSEELTSGVAELARAEVLESRLAGRAELDIPALIISFFSTNIFHDLTNARDISIISVVIFGMIFGVAALLVCEEDSEQSSRIKNFVNATQAVVMKMVRLVMALTPFGVFALMTKVIAGSDGGAIINLISFVAASYLAIAIMFVVHGVIIMLMGHNPKAYVTKVWPVLSFAFVTRSSAATIPLTIKAQVEDLNIPAPIANIAASFGATIGQNGCAGIYPAMLAVMVAPSMGVNPLEPGFIVSLILIVAIGSFGIAGVGGGATNAALVVLPAMGFPVTIAALLISIEPLIDMARTALNVNGAMTAGIVTHKISRYSEKKQTEGEGYA